MSNVIQIEWDSDDPNVVFSQLVEDYSSGAESTLDLECGGPPQTEAFDLVCSRLGPGCELVQALSEIHQALKPGGVMVVLAVGELHRIEAQEVFGRGANWPPVRPCRFTIPEKLASAGLELVTFSEYYGAGYYPDLDAYVAALAKSQIIADLDPERDALFVRELGRQLKTERGLRDTEHMAVFVAAKPG